MALQKITIPLAEVQADLRALVKRLFPEMPDNAFVFIEQVGPSPFANAGTPPSFQLVASWPLPAVQA